MTIALRQPMTVDAFLAWEGEQEERWEFDGFQPVAMVGGTSARQLIAGNLHARLWQRLRGSPCRAYREGMKIRPANSVRYPDVFVTCSPVANPSAVLAMPEIGVRLVLGDLYEGVIERPATNSAPAP